MRQFVGWIRLELEEPQRGTILIDGLEVGQAPVTEPIPVSAGRHDLEVRADGYLPSRRLVVVTGGTVRRVTLRLQESGMAGALYFSSRLLGVEVHVDGQVVGQTPLEGSIRMSPDATWSRRLVRAIVL